MTDSTLNVENDPAPSPPAFASLARGAPRRFRPIHLRHILGPRRKAAAGPRVLMAGSFAAMRSPGGGETQWRATLEALARRQVTARIWRPWETPLGEAQILHLFDSTPDSLAVVAAAHAAGLKVALSTIAWFSFQSLWLEPRSIGWRLRACGQLAMRYAAPRWRTWRRRLYDACDVLLPNSRAEAEQLQRLFGVPEEKIQVVPNGAEPRFAKADPELFTRHAGLRSFVLYAGRVEPRKNQLGFLRAMRGADVPIVVMGDSAPGHEGYYEACRRVADDHVRFEPRRAHHDPLLASAYAACGCLALASWHETPGLVALEAGLTGAPLVLPRGGCTREYFGSYARYVRPNRPEEIRGAVLAAVNEPRNPELARHILRHFTWAAAAAETQRAYERLLHR